MFRITLLINSMTMLVCVALGQDPAPAQSESINLLQYPGGVPQGLIPGDYPLYVLMNNKKVLNELKITESQAKEWSELHKKLQAIREASNKKIDPEKANLLAKLKGFSKEERNTEAYTVLDAQLGEMETREQNQAKEMADREDRQLLKLLDRPQQIRLKEIRIQAEGPQAFERQEIQAAMGLLPEQTKEIKYVKFQYMRKLRKSATVPQNSIAQNSDSRAVDKVKSLTTKVAPQEIRRAQSKMADSRVEAMKSIEKILDGTQRKVYKKMVGEPFDFLRTEDDDEHKTEKSDKEKRQPNEDPDTKKE